MRIAILALGALVAMATAMDPSAEEDAWEEWKQKYSKSYPVEDEAARMDAWLENADYVDAHNSRGDVGFRMELNTFADELSVSLGDPEFSDPIEFLVPSAELLSAPVDLDWRKKGVITAVKDQGMLGTVEAFVAAECVESFHAIHTGLLYNLSAAEVAICCSEVIGLPVTDDVFGCIHNIGGLCTTDSYQMGASCDNKTCDAVAQVSGTSHVPKNDEKALQQFLLQQPLFVTVNASPQSFAMYESGIYDDPNCVGKFLNHVLQLVGYGVDEKGHEYWICKNSWGTDWGMAGYMFIERGVNRCGIGEDAKYPH